MILAVRSLDDQALLALGVLAEAHHARTLGQDRRILGLARLEQVGHARQTTGDVAGLGCFLRDLGDHVAHAHGRAILQVDDRARRQQVLRRQVGARDVEVVAVLVDDAHDRAQVLALRATTLGIGDLARGQAGQLVGLLDDGDAVDEVHEADETGHFRDDRVVVRIPVGDRLAGLDLGRVLDGDGRAVGQLVALALAAVAVEHRQFARARHHRQVAAGVLHRLEVVELDRAGGLDRDVVDRRRTRSRAADVERTHRQLRAGLADRLRGHHAHGLAEVDQVATAQVAAVAVGADAEAAFAGDGRAHLERLHAGVFQLLHPCFVEQGVAGDDRILVVARQEHVLGHHAAEHAVAQRLDHVAAFHDRGHGQAVAGAAVGLGDHHVLCHVDQAAGQVTGVRGLQRGIRQALTGAVGRDEVLLDVQAFAEVRGDRRLDDRAVGLGHQAAHAGQLADLRLRTTRAGVGHDVDRVHRLLVDGLALGVGHLLGADRIHHRLGHALVGARPDVDHLVVALARGDQARLVLLLDLQHLGLGLGEDALLLVRDGHVVDADRHAGAGREAEAGVHQLVGEHDRVLQPQLAVAAVDQARDVLLGQLGVGQREGQALGQDLGQQRAPDRGFHDRGLLLAVAFLVDHRLGDAHLHLGVQAGDLVVVGAARLGHVGEHHALARGVLQGAGHVVQAEHHVLRGHDDRLAIGRREDVVGGHHQRARLQLGLQAQRDVHGHLVTVEVGVERGADQRVQLDRLALDQHRLERLDAQAMQGRRAVEQHRVLADDFFQDVPDFRLFALDQLLGGLDRRGQATALQLGEDEGLEQLQRHLLRQAALVQAQGRAHHDDRTARVVDALAEQVLPEAALLALDHVGQRLERALVGAGDGAAAAAVVHQRVHRLLQHALFIAHDDVGRVELEQAAQAVVAVDDAAVQVVEVGGREAAAVQRHQRTQVRRQHRQHGHDHPLGTVARLEEGLDQLDALGQALELGLRTGGGDLFLQLDHFGLQVDRAQQVVHRLCAHRGVEVVAVLLAHLHELLFVEQLAALERGQARLGDDERLEVQDALDVAQGHVQHQADARGQRLEEPDVGDRRGQVDVAHALAAHLGQGHFRAALLADHAAVLHALVLAAQALVVLDRTEDGGAEQAVALGLERAVIDGLGLLHLAVGPRADQVRRSQRDLDRVEVRRRAVLVEEVQQVFHVFLQD